MIKLSILICSLQKRLVNFALLAGKLQAQAEGKPVEILWLGDNKVMSVGEKRNKCLQIAQGEHICFIDDDDMVADDYVDEILKALEKNPDCVCFECSYSNEVTGIQNHVYFARRNDIVNYEARGVRHRPVNHLNPVRRSIALQIGFEHKNFGEDTAYGKRLWNSRLLTSDVTIPKVLYYYRFNPLKSETHGYNPAYRKVDGPVEPGILMDVVMVSDGAKAELMDMTQYAINTIAADNVNVIVVEKGEKIKYANADTILQKSPFNYNQCLNDGAYLGNAEYILFTNNDVIFPQGFVEEALKLIRATRADVLSFTNQHNFIHKEIISGFCFLMKRSAWEQIGGHNTDYKFWCADNVTTEQLKKHKLMEVKSSIVVHHLCSVSLNKLDATTRHEYTDGCVKEFNRDYNQNVLNRGKAAPKMAKA